MRTKERTRFGLKYLPMDMARLVCSPLLLFYRMKRITPTGEPYKGKIRGGAVLAANHTSFSDPFLVGVSVWYRRMYFLAAEVVMQPKFRAWLLRGVGAIKIDRNATDIDAIRQSVSVLKQGHLLAIFPQGQIEKEDQMQTLKSGVTLLAMQAGVPIVPIHLLPAKHWYSRRVAVIGEQLDPKAIIQKKFPSTADIEMVTAKLLEEMNRCAGISKEQTYADI